MSLGRFLLVARREVAHTLFRPLVIVWILLLGLAEWQMAAGHVRIMMSGDSSIGGKEQWLTSEFAVAQVLAAFVAILYTFFVSIAAGMSVIRDEELKVGAILHSTPLTPREYLWGKFSGGLFVFAIVLALHLLFTIFFRHVMPNTSGKDIVGPFSLINYVRPALVFAIPTIVLLAGTGFAIGALTRRPILVFVLPITMLAVCGFFLWSWAPDWLDPRINRALMLADPTGYRWLIETWLKQDRGVDFYNNQPIAFDTPFLIARAAALLIGLLPVAFCARRYARIMRGVRHGAAEAARIRVDPTPVAASGLAERLSRLDMSASSAGLLSGVLAVVRFELRELRFQPGLYLFVPIILMQTLAQSTLRVGAFDTPLLQTSGTLAMGTMNMLTLLVCALLMFYVVESQQRERNTGLAPIYSATSASTAAIILGKTLANALIAVVILIAAWLGCVISMAIQGIVPITHWQFVLVWGALLFPTFLIWCSFITAVIAVTRSRYTTYAVGIGVFAYTFYRQFGGEMNWVGNWNLWSAGAWSDISIFELDGVAIALNRVMVLGLSVLFAYIAIRFSGRRELDAVRILHRLRPVPVLRFALGLVPFLIVPAVCGSVLWVKIHDGFQGDKLGDERKDYWKQNLATWREAPLPAIAAVDLDVDLKPAGRAFSVKGSYRLENRTGHALARIPITTGTQWGDIAWAMNGEKYEPEDRSRLFVFYPHPPLENGEALTIGFSYDGVLPKGITENGGGVEQFILPAGVVLTSFSPTFVPVMGFVDEIGVDEDNKFEPRDYPDDFYEGVTPSAFGGGGGKFTTRIRISGPDEYTYNSVGVLESESVENCRRTVEWVSDHPVSFFNIVAGRWKVRSGNGTKIFYNTAHGYNIDEMLVALNAARKYYSEWFYPFPWQELKLSEFAGLAFYAQGFPTNITFSEGIGFLTRDDPRSNAAFWVTAHESAHQWWGNILVPGLGPGGNLLSEGMAHFSTILLTGQVKGLHDRIEFCKGIEKRYADSRRIDAERPLVKIDGDKPGDTTVQYDKGGWVFWMLLNQMGRGNALAGLQEFIRYYDTNPDHPVLQDFVRMMRTHAPDPAAFDAFVKQWFFDVVVPQYTIHDAQLEQTTSGTWRVTARLENTGSGRMPVELAAFSGERFTDSGSLADQFREARTTISPGAGESVDFAIECYFKPKKLIVDPDALVLQLRRTDAQFGF